MRYKDLSITKLQNLKTGLTLMSRGLNNRTSTPKEIQDNLNVAIKLTDELINLVNKEDYTIPKK